MTSSAVTRSGRSYQPWTSRWFAAQAHWPTLTIDVLGVVGGSQALPVLCVRIPRADGRMGPRIAITAGIHGDEPAGVEALTRLLERPREWAPVLSPFDVMLFPCANPSGFELDTRANDAGIDLNRTFDQDDAPRETIWMRARLSPTGNGSRVDVAIELHEDIDGEGFYLYELTQGPPFFGESVVNAMRPLLPIDPRRAIEGFSARDGVIRPDPTALPEKLSRQWPQAMYSFRSGTPLCLTFETPSGGLPMDVRAEGHLAALRAALAAAHGPSSL